VLVYVLGEDVHSATTASLAVVVAAALAGGAVQASRTQVCWAQVAVFVPAALAGVVAGTLANEAVGGDVILLAFVPVLLAAAAFTWTRAGGSEHPEQGCPPLDPGRASVAGLAVGGLTGFLGVGGGFLVVPMLALAMSFSLRRAIGTSLVIVGFVSVAGLGVHLWRGAEVDAGPTAAMALGCAIGALAGARIATRLPQRTLGRAFSTVLVAVGAFLLVAGALPGG